MSVSVTQKNANKDRYCSPTQSPNDRSYATSVRNRFTAVLSKAGLSEYGFRVCTEAIYKGIFGVDRRRVLSLCGYKERTELRDILSSKYLILVSMVEEAITELVNTLLNRTRSMLSDDVAALLCYKVALEYSKANDNVQKLLGDIIAAVPVRSTPADIAIESAIDKYGGAKLPDPKPVQPAKKSRTK